MGGGGGKSWKTTCGSYKVKAVDGGEAPKETERKLQANKPAGQGRAVREEGLPKG